MTASTTDLTESHNMPDLIPPQTYRCGIRTATADDRVALRIIRDTKGDPRPQEIAPAEMDLVMPANDTMGLLPGDLVTLSIVKVQV